MANISGRKMNDITHSSLTNITWSSHFINNNLCDIPINYKDIKNNQLFITKDDINLCCNGIYIKISNKRAILYGAHFYHNSFKYYTIKSYFYKYIK